MNKDQPIIVGYGVYYRANNQLIKSVHARIMLQVLIDQVRRQLEKSLSNTTVYLDRAKLSRLAGLDKDHTGPGSLRALEQLGLVKLYTNAVTINCDEYVTTVLHYEKLSDKDRATFAKEFKKHGVDALKIFSVEVDAGCRSKLIDMKGSSITENFQLSTTPTNISSTENFQLSYNRLSESLKIFSRNCNSSVLQIALSAENLQSPEFDEIKTAFLTGNLSETCFSDPNFDCKFSVVATEIFQLIGQKQLKIFSTVIIEDKIKDKREPSPKTEPKMKDENFQETSKNIFDGWGQVSIVDLDNPSEEDLEISEPIEDFNMEVSRKRASRILKNRNPYKNKPFFKIKRVEEIVEVLDEVIKSPVEFFIYNFVWGLYDLYCDHYQPSRKYDEQGDEIVEPQDYNWKEMVGALLPQDEVCSLALNIYEDLQGAFEQGYYEMVDESGNTWKHTFSFDTLEEFNPVQIFQWEPYKMQDKVTPAFKVAINKFYDIEADDALLVSKTITKEDKQRHTNQDKTFIELIRNTDNSQLTPMEKAVKKFYDDFVVVNDEGYIEQFLDGKGEPMEGNGRLPDFKIKPWCVGRSIKYADFVDMFAVTYKPCDGLPKRAYIFSAERVVRWNELNGYRDSIAHQALQA